MSRDAPVNLIVRYRVDIRSIQPEEFEETRLLLIANAGDVVKLNQTGSRSWWRGLRKHWLRWRAVE